jgi:hypothetical protein
MVETLHAPALLPIAAPTEKISLRRPRLFAVVKTGSPFTPRRTGRGKEIAIAATYISREKQNGMIGFLCTGGVSYALYISLLIS